MAVAKVIYKASAEATPEVWIDNTQKTVTAGSMLSGTTALKNDGTDITGTIASKTSSDLTASGATITAPAGYYASDASKSVASGTAGTPTASKGTVSNHSISVTPSVTNTTGYITGGTKNGTAVTVNVTELESGTKSITANGTGISVSGYSAVDVAVEQNAESLTVTPSTNTKVYAGESLASGTVQSAVSIHFSPSLTNGHNYRVYAECYLDDYTPVFYSSGWIDYTASSSAQTFSNYKIMISSSMVTGTSSSYYTCVYVFDAEDDTVYSPVVVNSVSQGSATTPATTITANPTITLSSSGLITATASATQSVTPTISAGYVSSGTAGTITVSGSNTSQLSTQAAQTIHPSTTAQSISSGKYLTGAQTISAVTLSNLTAGNIKKDVVVKIGDSSDDDCVASVTGTYEGSGGGGLVYETGTWTPTEDVADTTISFANSHTTAPLFVMICDSSTDNLTENSNYFSSLSDQYGFIGFAYVKGNYARYGVNVYGFASSTGLSGTFSSMGSETSYNSYFSSLGFRAYGGATSRYWRSGRTYKWIAVWAPTT